MGISMFEKSLCNKIKKKKPSPWSSPRPLDQRGAGRVNASAACV